MTHVASEISPGFGRANGASEARLILA